MGKAGMSAAGGRAAAKAQTGMTRWCEGSGPKAGNTTVHGGSGILDSLDAAPLKRNPEVT